MSTTFKRCSLCGKEWGTREEFVNDSSLHFDGHQRNRRKVLLGRWVDGLLIYTHRVDECGTTLAIEPSLVRGEPVFG